ncbi:MAG TPA: hypothetical protein VMF52_03510 [Steroidobacteraceae bacterium]|nr:hypothetical protein [Steroidobacteraceae bacterium]
MNQEQIEQYVSGKLVGKDAEEFEAYCVANPEFAKNVEFEQRLRAGLAQVARGSTAEFVRSHGQSRWKFAAAASIVLALGAFSWAWWHQSAKLGRALMAAVSTEAQRNGPSLRLAQVRGAESVPHLGSAVMRVEIVGLFDVAANYSITLDRVTDQQQPAETLTTLYGQHPSSPVTLEFMLDSEDLPAGAYTLRVRKQSADEEPLDFAVLKP